MDMGIIEWDDPINPFNTWKILFHADHLRQIAEGKFPPPITMDTDPTNACNHNCMWCNSKVYRKETGPVSLSTEHLLCLATFLADWGVLSTCIAGGGEPLLHPGYSDYVRALCRHDLEVGTISNAVLLKTEHIDVLTGDSHVRYFGWSMDAGTPDTYARLHGTRASDFEAATANIETLCTKRDAARSYLDVTAKFLVHPDNVHEIARATRIARESGCCAIQIRPVAIENVRGVENPRSDGPFHLGDQLDVITQQIDEARTLQTDSFRVYAVVHKFGPRMEKVVRFKRCLATPILGVLGADGWAHLCFNARGWGGMRLCRHVPDPWAIQRVWGSDHHKKLIAAIDPAKCTRCTFTRYNEILERAIAQDGMFWKFP